MHEGNWGSRLLMLVLVRFYTVSVVTLQSSWRWWQSSAVSYVFVAPHRIALLTSNNRCAGTDQAFMYKYITSKSPYLAATVLPFILFFMFIAIFYIASCFAPTQDAPQSDLAEKKSKHGDPRYSNDGL